MPHNFAISDSDDSVHAAVASQPAMPFFRQGSLHMSAEDVTDVRNALDEKGAMQVLRFENDPLCTYEKSSAFTRPLMTMAPQGSMKSRCLGKAIQSSH